MTLRERTAAALDKSLVAAACKAGIKTDKVRDSLAAYLDGSIKLKASTVRAMCGYLEMVAR
jgi:hypothetical protein